MAVTDPNTRAVLDELCTAVDVRRVLVHGRLQDLLSTPNTLSEAVVRVVRESINELAELADKHKQPLRLGLDEDGDKLHVFIGHPNGFALWAVVDEAVGIVVHSNGEEVHAGADGRACATALCDALRHAVRGHSFDGTASNAAPEAAEEPRVGEVSREDGMFNAFMSAMAKDDPSHVLTVTRGTLGTHLAASADVVSQQDEA